MESILPESTSAIIKIIKRNNQCEQTTQFIDYCIPCKSSPLAIIQHNYTMLTTQHKKALGTVYGAVIGDSFGSISEFASLDYKRNTISDFNSNLFDYKNPPKVEGAINHCHLKCGQWSDDTSMTLCILDSILQKGEYDWKDIKTRFISWWFLGYNNGFQYDADRKHKNSVGLGGTICKSLMEYILNPDTEYSKCGTNQSGNGTIMRNAAIPACFFNNTEYAMDFSMKQSMLTHNGMEAAECAKLLSYIVCKAINYKYSTPQELLDSIIMDKLDLTTKACIALKQSKIEEGPFVADDYNNSLIDDRNWNWRNPNFTYSKKRSIAFPQYIGSYAMDGLAMALHCVYYTKSYKEAITKMVNLGGDADTVACIGGQMAGAIYGIDNIPSSWLDNVLVWDKGSIGARVLDGLARVAKVK